MFWESFPCDLLPVSSTHICSHSTWHLVNGTTFFIPLSWAFGVNYMLVQHDSWFKCHSDLFLGHYSVYHIWGPQSRALCGTVCALSIAINWLIVSLLILIILFSMFFVLIHDYTLCFTGSPCCNFSYYNFISIWPYYIVIHLYIMDSDHINSFVHIKYPGYALPVSHLPGHFRITNYTKGYLGMLYWYVTEITANMMLENEEYLHESCQNSSWGIFITSTWVML